MHLTTRLPIFLLLMGTLFVSLTDLSAAENTAPSEPLFHGFRLYRTPADITPSPTDQASDCRAIEHEIAALEPQTYSYKPDFYSDPYQGASVLIGTTIFMPAYAISGYSGYLQYKENGRVISAENRIEVLRHLKAEKRCFEG